MLRASLRFVTLAALFGALAVSIWWWWDPAREWLQAPGTTLALVAAVAGIPADRWAAQAQRRSRALSSLTRELAQNREVLLDPRFQPEHQGVGGVYPRLMLGAVDTALISGALDARRDADLARRLLDWHNAAQDLNRRLDITELRLCTIDQLDREELQSLRDMVRRPDGHFAMATQLMDGLQSALDAALAPPRWLRRVTRRSA